jgi:hypothetical protein
MRVRARMRVRVRARARPRACHAQHSLFITIRSSWCTKTVSSKSRSQLAISIQYVRGHARSSHSGEIGNY